MLPAHASLLDLPSLLLHSLRLDMATVCYVFAFTLLLYWFNFFTARKPAKTILVIYSSIVLSAFSILLISNIFLYKSWGTLINYRALSFITDTGEIIASITTAELVGGLLFSGFSVYLFLKLFLKKVLPFFTVQTTSLPVKIGVPVALVVLTAIGSRGGLQLIPINESAVYFSSNTKLNHAAVNPVWYLGHNILQSSGFDKNPFSYFDNAVAQKNKNLLYKNSLLSDSILNTPNPNIIIIMIESYTADIIKSLGGDSNTTPNFENLIADGLLFTNIYSSGFRTDQAFVSVLSGFPAQPNHSIIRFPEKAEHLPSLTKKMKAQGYNNSFYYGGELGFSNLNSYLLSTGFEKIIGIDDFDKSQLNSKWGAHDEFVLTKQLDDVKKFKQPFFSVLMTLSSHEPFETPIPTPFTQSNLPSKFRRAAWYTDKCLGDYFINAKKQAWYNNTLIVLVADHGHLLPLQRDYFDVRARRIPLLITGGALKTELRGKKIHVTGNQNDLPATLLSQLSNNPSDFMWSNNLLAKDRTNFAYVCMDNAIGWINDSCSFVFYTESNKIESSNQNCLSDSGKAKSYLQILYDEFLNIQIR